MIGIYRIRNKINNNSYYGSSENIDKRWKTHKSTLRNGTHMNCVLQRAWDKYGENNFSFEIVEECEKYLLLETEQKYLDLNPDYNIGKTSSGGDNLTNHPNRKEIIEKITKTLIEKIASMTDEEKKQKWSRPKELNPNWRGGPNIKYCKCGNKIALINNTCTSCRDRTGTNNPFYGKKHSEEYKKQSSENQTGKYNGEQNKPIEINGIEYRSAGVASKELDICMATIRWRVLSKNPKYENYFYKGTKKICYTQEEQSKKISKPQLGKKMNHNKPFMIDGIKYRTLKEASERLGIHIQTIKGRLKRTTFNNYKYL